MVSNDGAGSGYVPPDGGYGWVVVGCSFVMHMFTTGTIFSLSVLYVSWLEEIGATKSETSWIVSIGMAIMFGIGPVPAYLAGEFGYRKVCILGSIIASAGFILSSFANSVNMLIFSIGVLGGIGLGFCYLPAVAMVALYFSSKRAMALGICTAGAGIGSFIQAPLVNFLEKEFGWRGTLLIMSAIVLNNAVCGMLLRPMDVTGNSLEMTSTIKNKEEMEGEDTLGPLSDPLSAEEELLAKMPDLVENGVLHTSRNGAMYDPPTVTCELVDISCLSQSRDSAVSGIASEISLEGNPQNVINQLVDAHVLFQDTERPYLLTGSARHLSTSNPHVKTNPARLCSSAADVRQSHNLKQRYRSTDGKRNQLVLRDIDIMLSGSIHSLRIFENASKSNNKLDFSNYHMEQYSPVEPCQSEETDSSEEFPVHSACTSALQRLKSFWHFFSLLNNKVFFVLAVSTILTNLSFLMPVLYMVDRAVENGIDKSMGAIFVSLNGAGHVFGKLFFAVIAGRSCVDSLVLYIVVLALCGLGTCASSACGSVVALHAIYAFFFGSTMGGYCSLGPVVVVDLLGVEKVGQAYGILCFFAGVSGSVGPPLAGWVYGRTGNFMLAYFIHGVLIALSAIILIPFAAFKHCQRCKKGETST